MSKLIIIEPYQTGYLPEQSGHRVFYQLFGNPSGIPILFLHGGPGCGFEIDYLPLFDLNKINLITFDQRGCGQSQLSGQMDNNTTQDLIKDAEKLREMLNINQWIVCGHSWGATLSIIYGLYHPSKVKSICIASFFGGLRRDQEWSFEGIKKFYPAEVKALFSTRQSQDKNLNLDAWIYNNLTSNNQELSIETAFYLLKLENEVSQSIAPKDIKKSDVSGEVLSLYKLLFGYGKNDFFVTEEFLYNSTIILPPTILVHGRLDFDCLPEQAYRLKNAYPSVDLRFVKGGYHSVFEQPMFGEFQQAIDEITSNFIQ
jgi:proline iminopeptidase